MTRGNKFADVVSHISDAVIIVDDDGVVLFANPAAERLFGRSRAELVGELFGFPIETKSSAELAILRGKEHRYAEMRVVDFEWEGRSAKLASLRDTTDRKRAEDLQARLLHADRLASIGRLASGVAHEVNNPATFIRLNLGVMKDTLGAFIEVFAALAGGVMSKDGREVAIDDLLEDYDVPARMTDLRELVSDNLDGIDRIVNIVKDLRCFSRIERDEVELVDINEIVGVACHMTANEIRHRAQLIMDLGRIPLIVADRGKLSQVLINLIINAAHAIEEGAAERNTIRVRTWQERKYLFLTVEDTGRGIPEGLRTRIFEPFFTTKPRDEGTGLGLALSAEIIRRHGGEIAVTSPPGPGTCFQITLPVDTPMASRVHNVDGPPILEQGTTGHRERILLVDDEPVLVYAFRRILEDHHEVVTASGGAEALRILSEDRDFDVILLDLMMPEVDGMMVYETLRERNPELLERIVFCTGGVFTTRVKNFITSIPNICLDKPIATDVLLNVVERVARNTRRGNSST